jgi:hypothetical protein
MSELLQLLSMMAVPAAVLLAVRHANIRADRRAGAVGDRPRPTV